MTVVMVHAGEVSVEPTLDLSKCIECKLNCIHSAVRKPGVCQLAICSQLPVM